MSVHTHTHTGTDSRITTPVWCLYTEYSRVAEIKHTRDDNKMHCITMTLKYEHTAAIGSQVPLTKSRSCFGNTHIFTLAHRACIISKLAALVQQPRVKIINTYGLTPNRRLQRHCTQLQAPCTHSVSCITVKPCKSTTNKNTAVA